MLRAYTNDFQDKGLKGPHKRWIGQIKQDLKSPVKMAERYA